MVVRHQQGAKSYLAHLEGVFAGAVRVVARKKGYVVLRAEAPGADTSNLKSSPTENAPVTSSRGDVTAGREDSRTGSFMSIQPHFQIRSTRRKALLPRLLHTAPAHPEEGLSS